MKSRQKPDHKRQARITRRRESRELKHKGIDYTPATDLQATYSIKKEIAPLRALTEAQGHYLCSIEHNTITFGIGPAGTGKSYCAAGIASELLKDGKIDKIIITRPGVEAGESFGHLPGEIEEKYAPYIEPFRNILNERLGRSYTDYLIKQKRIEAKPLAYMRGLTFNDAFVILDEAQNVTVSQMKMFLTRIGRNCTVVVDGDIAQQDIHGLSGLQDAVQRLKGVPGVNIVEFVMDDIVRSGIVKALLIAYSK
ncbi:MAG: PhoH family protein [Methylobacter sp.]